MRTCTRADVWGIMSASRRRACAAKRSSSEIDDGGDARGAGNRGVAGDGDASTIGAAAGVTITCGGVGGAGRGSSTVDAGVTVDVAGGMGGAAAGDEGAGAADTDAAAGAAFAFAAGMAGSSLAGLVSIEVGGLGAWGGAVADTAVRAVATMTGTARCREAVVTGALLFRLEATS